MLRRERNGACMMRRHGFGDGVRGGNGRVATMACGADAVPFGAVIRVRRIGVRDVHALSLFDAGDATPFRGARHGFQARRHCKQDGKEGHHGPHFPDPCSHPAHHGNILSQLKVNCACILQWVDKPSQSCDRHMTRGGLEATPLGRLLRLHSRIRTVISLSKDCHAASLTPTARTADPSGERKLSRWA